MLFWICVIIVVISGGVLLWASSYVSKEQKEFDKLDKDYEHWSNLRVYLPYGSSQYVQIIKEQDKAFSAYSQFKEKHPNLSKKKDRQERARTISLVVCAVAAIFCLIMGRSLWYNIVV